MAYIRREYSKGRQTATRKEGRGAKEYKLAKKELGKAIEKSKCQRWRNLRQEVGNEPLGLELQNCNPQARGPRSEYINGSRNHDEHRLHALFDISDKREGRVENPCNGDSTLQRGKTDNSCDLHEEQKSAGT